MKESNFQILTSSFDPSALPGQTMIEVFEKRAVQHPHKVIYHFLEDGLNISSSMTYGEMNRQVKAIAAEMQQKFSKGDRALLLFPPGIEFIVSLMGCMYAGIIAVPAYPPRKNRLFERFSAIISDCTPSFIFTTKKIREDIQKNFREEASLQGLGIMAYEEVEPEQASSWKDCGIQPNDLVLLQYSSGSTGSPNGVMVDHKSLLHNSEVIRRAFGHTEHLQGVNWLPGFHDMGLIGALIQPAYIGGANAIIPPNVFLSRPLTWLKSITAFRSNTAGGPNFALQHCIDRFSPEEAEGIDLGSVRPFFCGAEPIRQETLRAFSDKFASYGFTYDQFYPCYGLAESVLFVTGGALDAEPVCLSVDGRALEQGKVVIVEEGQRGAKRLVGCGYPWLGTGVVIADPSTMNPCPAGTVGEIWTSGPSITQGYWNKPELTLETFQARLSDTTEGPFLRTGDLGFIHDGQLYITGRIKDLIIIRGMNHYPHDLERTVENAHESLQSSSGAAFSIEAGNEERLVLVQEVRRTHLRDLNAGEVIAAIRRAVTENHQLQAYAILLVRTGSIAKTSSGKIQRFKAREEFLRGGLDIIAQWQMEHPSPDAPGPIPTATGPSHPTDDVIILWIRNWMSKELSIDVSTIEANTPIASYGLDSLKAVLLASDAAKEFSIDWPLDLFLEETTIEEIVRKGKEFNP